MNIKIIILCGLEDTGKTTIANKIIKEKNNVYYHNFFKNNEKLRQDCKLFLHNSDDVENTDEFMNGILSQSDTLFYYILNSLINKKEIIIFERFIFDIFFFQRNLINPFYEHQIKSKMDTFSVLFGDITSVFFLGSSNNQSEKEELYLKTIKDKCHEYNLKFQPILTSNYSFCENIIVI